MKIVSQQDRDTLQIVGVLTEVTFVATQDNVNPCAAMV